MQKFFNYVRNILEIALPIMLGHIGFIMIGAGDVIVAGRHSTDTLSAISIATAITNCIMIFGIGVLATISSILSNYRGEGKRAELYFGPTMKFGFILSVLTSMIFLGCVPLIDLMGFEYNLAVMIKNYIFVTAFSTFGVYLHCLTREFLQAFEIVMFPNILSILCVFLNIGLNILFVFGYGFLHEMGATGLAVASLATRYFMGIVLLIYTIKKLSIGDTNDSRYYKDLLKVGLPSSFAIMIEFIGFNAISVILGRVAGIYAAAHTILTTITSIAFMIPLSVSIAVSVKVGFTNGAGDYKSLKQYAKTGIFISILVMFCSAICISLFPRFIVNLFTPDAKLISVCLPIMYILCLYQIFDGLQVSLSGIYRGLKQTNVVMISNFIAYWLISLPLGYYLGIIKNMNLIGFWYGIIIAALVLCSIMSIVLIKKLKRLENASLLYQ